MTQLYIIGEGPLAQIAFEYATLMKESGTMWSVAGIILPGNDFKAEYPYDAHVEGSYNKFHISDNQVFICPIADYDIRASIVGEMTEKGCEFVNVIHPYSNVFSTASLGKGNLIGAFSTISANTVIGNHNIIQDLCNIGHDTKIGNFNHLFVNCTLCGMNEISDKSTIYTGTLVYPKVKIGTESVVGAASVVVRKVKDNETVVGNPAKKLE
ncbi:MAG: hypothetical protein PHD11_01195 [Bacteroidales bacterium]|nr:hypothetical protein [Bacteroidales bacterium]MDD4669668.1 hypothetical protein [Bacteroidales bacterium]